MDATQLNAGITNSSLTPYLVFRLNGSEYAIHVEHVREIITGVTPSAVPGAPDYLIGVVNLRGKILPLIDMRKRFHLPITEDDGRQCYVVLMLDYDEQCFELGVRVDAVCEVQRIAASSIDNISDISNYATDRLAFQGVAKTASGITMIVDSRQLIEQLRGDVRVKMATSLGTAANINAELCLV